VQTHLEPLEEPLAARPPDPLADREARQQIDRLVQQRTGTRPRQVRLLSTEAGRVVFLTLQVGADKSLSEAHRIAGALEEQLRLQLPDIADVVVHTEP
jgi:divalent metal cation (Fe/Co/Zn/Cd) transporter